MSTQKGDQIHLGAMQAQSYSFLLPMMCRVATLVVPKARVNVLPTLRMHLFLIHKCLHLPFIHCAPTLMLERHRNFDDFIAYHSIASYRLFILLISKTTQTYCIILSKLSGLMKASRGVVIEPTLQSFSI